MIDISNPRHKTDVPLIILFSLLIAIVLCFSSCSAEWHIKRAIKKNPNILKSDTILVNDTVLVPEVRHDTTIISKPIDTILIEKDRLKIKILRHYDTLQVTGGCDADTIIHEIKIPYEKIIFAPKKWYERWWLWSFVAVLFIVFYYKK